MAVTDAMTMTETGYDIANNYSLVYVKITCAVSGSSYNNNTQTGTFSFEGQTYSYSYKLPKSTTTTVYENTFTVYHDNEGKKTVVGSYSFPTTPAGGTKTGSQTLKLTDIPRQANITGATNFNDEGYPYMEYNNAGGLPINVRLEFGGTEIRRDDVANTGNYTFGLTDYERNLLRSKCTSNSMTVRYTVATKIDGVEKFWSWLDMTMTIVNANPVFSNFAYEDTNTTVTNITGNNQVLVKGLSNLRLGISASNKMIAQKGATAKNYIVTIDNINKSIDYSDSDIVTDIGTITASGTKRLNVRAFDSRTNSTLAYKDIVVYDYDKPVINATAIRLNNFENETTLKVNGTYSRLTINGTDKNIVTKLQYRYCQENGDWTEWTALNSTIENGKFICDDVILSLDNKAKFIFEIQAIDNLDQQTETLNVDIGEAIFFISSNKKACYINGEEILVGDKLINLIYPVGSIYISANSTSPATLFGGIWEQIKDRFLLACGNSYANGVTGGEATHTLIENEMPRHNHILSPIALANGTRTSKHLVMQGDGNLVIYDTNGTASWASGTTNEGEASQFGWSIGQNGSGTGTTQTGGGQAHNNMPPYIAVYVWKRTG